MRWIGQIGWVVSSVWCLALAPAALAQVTWEAGVKGGIALSKVTGDTRISESEVVPGVGTIAMDGDIDSFRTGLAAGGFAIAKISERFGIRLEVLYAQMGGKGDVNVTLDSSPAGVAKTTIKFDYFEIPLLAVGSFSAGEKAMIDIFGGPSLAFNTGAKLQLEFEGEEDEEDVKSDLKSTDFGLVVGAGVTILASEAVNVVIDARYTFGLTNVLDVTPSEDLKNSSIAFMAGVSFPIGQ